MTQDEYLFLFTRLRTDDAVESGSRMMGRSRFAKLRCLASTTVNRLLLQRTRPTSVTHTLSVYIKRRSAPVVVGRCARARGAVTVSEFARLSLGRNE